MTTVWVMLGYAFYLALLLDEGCALTITLIATV
jgi:hypothetical protein